VFAVNDNALWRQLILYPRTEKTVLLNLEPEDLRAITLVTSGDTGIQSVVAAKHAAQAVKSYE